MKSFLKFILLIAILISSERSHAWNDFIKVNINTDSSLLCIHFGNDGSGFIGGVSGTLFKTTNNGQTWNAVNSNWPLNILNYNIIDIQFFNKDSGYVILKNKSPRSLNYITLQTIDGGINFNFSSTWKVNATYQTRLEMQAMGEGVIGGGGFFVGNSFLLINQDTVTRELFYQFDYQEITCLTRSVNDHEYIMAGSNNGHLYHSFDNGSTWDTVSTNFSLGRWSGKQINGMASNGKDWLIAIEDQQSLHLSSDSGRTWRHIATTFAYPTFTSISFSKRDSFVAVGYSASFEMGEITYFDTNGFMVYQNFKQPFHGVAHNQIGDAFAVGDSGQLVYKKSARQTSLADLKEIQQVKLYPNPCDSYIHWNLKDGMEINQIEILDYQGRTIAKPNPWSNKWNVDDLRPGYYFIRFHLRNGLPQTAQFLVL